MTPKPVQEPEVELTVVRLGRGTGVIGMAIPVIAREKQFDEEFGIRFEILEFARAADTMTALLSGEVNITHSAFLQAESAILAGAKIKGIMASYYGGDKQVIVTLNTSGIKQVKDLVGKTVGVPGLGAPTEFFIRKAAEMSGISPDSINLIQLTMPEIFSGIATGQLDAGVAVEPFLTNWMTQQPGVVILMRGIEIPVTNYVPGAFLVRDDFLKENLELSYRIYLALAKASWYIRTGDSNEILSILEDSSGTPAEIIRPSLYKQVWDPRMKPCMVVNIWAEMELFVDAGKLSDMVPISELWWHGFYERASIEHPELFEDINDYLQRLEENGIVSDVDFITDWNQYLQTQT